MGKIIALILFVFALILFGCSTEYKQVSESLSEISPIVSVYQLETDKPLYHSGEIIHISAKVESNGELKNATARFYGIYSGTYRLDQPKNVDLVYGETILSLDYNAPSCYGCSGISPGRYNLTLDIYDDENKIAEKTITIEIQQ